MTIRNLAGLLICCAIFALLAVLNWYYAVSFVSFVVFMVLVAWCYDGITIHLTNRGWYNRR